MFVIEPNLSIFTIVLFVSPTTLSIFTQCLFIMQLLLQLVIVVVVSISKTLAFIDPVAVYLSIPLISPSIFLAFVLRVFICFYLFPISISQCVISVFIIVIALCLYSILVT